MAYAQEASRRFDVPLSWIEGVMWQESRFRTHFSNGRPIVSPAGAIGPMQVMPATYAELRRSNTFLGPNPYNPRDNVLAGTIYLRQMYDRFGAPGFLAAYNAGPGRYRQFALEGRRLPPETRHYIRVISQRIWGGSAPSIESPVWYASLDRPGSPQRTLVSRSVRRGVASSASPSAPRPPSRTSPSGPARGPSPRPPRPVGRS